MHQRMSSRLLGRQCNDMIQGWSHGVAIGRYFNRRYDVKSELRNLWKIEEIEFKSVMG